MPFKSDEFNITATPEPIISDPINLNPTVDIDNDVADDTPFEMLAAQLLGQDDLTLDMDDSLTLDELNMIEMDVMKLNKTDQNVTDDNGNNQNTDPNNTENNIYEQHTNAQTETTDSTMNIDHDQQIPQNTHNTNTSNNPTNLTDIPPHLLSCFKLIYQLKCKLNKYKTNLELLLEHKNSCTVPPGLRIHHKSKHNLHKQFRDQWENTLMDASLGLLDVTIDFHKHTIQDLEYKIKHRTTHLTEKYNDSELAHKIIQKTDQLFLTYTRQSIMTVKKNTKKVKRLAQAPNKTKNALNKTHPQTSNTTPTTIDTETTPTHDRNQATSTQTTPTVSITPNTQSCTNYKQTHKSTTSTNTHSCTPLMQVQTKYPYITASKNCTKNISQQQPRLRIPPKSQRHIAHYSSTQTNTTLPHSQAATTNKKTNAQHHSTWTNSNIPNSITQNIQSQIQNFLVRQLHKERK